MRLMWGTLWGPLGAGLLTPPTAGPKVSGLREARDGPEEAVEPIGHGQLAEHQGLRRRDDVAQAGLQEEWDHLPADPAGREAVAPRVQDGARQPAIGRVDRQGLPVVVVRD